MCILPSSPAAGLQALMAVAGSQSESDVCMAGITDLVSDMGFVLMPSVGKREFPTLGPHTVILTMLQVL